MDVNRAGLRYYAPESPRRRMGCWGGFACLKSRKAGRRIVPAARSTDGSAATSQVWMGNRPQPSGAPNQFTSISPSLLAPPSSPASFQNSAVHSSVQSPSLHVNRHVESTAMMFQTGPYAHETALVTPPVFSTFTTAPSTAPFTPPPELAHVTTPSSPEVPFAQLLTSSLTVRSTVRQQSDTTTASSTAPFTPPPELAHATTPSSPEVPFAQLLASSFAAKDSGGEQSDGNTASSTAPYTPPPEPAHTNAPCSPEVPFAQLLTSTFSSKAARQPEVPYSASPFASPDYSVPVHDAMFGSQSGSSYAHPLPGSATSGANPSVPKSEPMSQRSSPSFVPDPWFPILEPETWVEFQVRTGKGICSASQAVDVMPSEPSTSLFTICQADDLLRPDYVSERFEEAQELEKTERFVRTHSGRMERGRTTEGQHGLGQLTKVPEDDDVMSEDYLVLEGFHLDTNYRGHFWSSEEREDIELADSSTPTLKPDRVEVPDSGRKDCVDASSSLTSADTASESDARVHSPQGMPMSQSLEAELSPTSGLLDRGGAYAGNGFVGTFGGRSGKQEKESPIFQHHTGRRSPTSVSLQMTTSEAFSPRYGKLLLKYEELSLALQMAEAREREALQLLDVTKRRASSLEESVARLNVELSQQEIAFLDLQSRHFAHLGVSSPNHILSPGFNLVA